MHKTVAEEQMYQFYKTNKTDLPSNISCQRDFIVDALCQGQEISAVFALASQHAESAANQPWPKPAKSSSCHVSQGGPLAVQSPGSH